MWISIRFGSSGRPCLLGKWRKRLHRDDVLDKSEWTLATWAKRSAADLPGGMIRPR